MTITQHIEASGMSRKEICDRVGLSISMLSLIESGGRKASAPKAAALAQVLGVDFAVFRPDLAEFARQSPAETGTP